MITGSCYSFVFSKSSALRDRIPPFFRAHTNRLAINAGYSYLSIIQHYFCPCRRAQKFNPRQEQSNPAFVLPSQQQHPQTSFIDYSGYTARQSSAKFHRLFDT